MLYYTIHTYFHHINIYFIHHTYYPYCSGLQKQTNPEWVAYLFLTDDKPFEQRLLQIIDRFQDPRLRYFPVDKAHRPTVSSSSSSSSSSCSVYTVYMRENIIFCIDLCYVRVLNRLFCMQFSDVDGGYTATDYVLGKLLHEPSCEWLTVTNGDNMYGSEVVANVMAHTSDPVSAGGSVGGRGQVQMLLAPLDSRNFATLGK